MHFRLDLLLVLSHEVTFLKTTVHLRWNIRAASVLLRLSYLPRLFNTFGVLFLPRLQVCAAGFVLIARYEVEYLLVFLVADTSDAARNTQEQHRRMFCRQIALRRGRVFSPPPQDRPWTLACVSIRHPWDHPSLFAWCNNTWYTENLLSVLHKKYFI